MTEPENLVLILLREMRAEMKSEFANVRSEMKSEFADVRSELRSEIHSLRADVASDMLTLEKRLSDQIATLRRAVMEYHSSAIGHGVLISEFEDRLRRVEQHLNLSAPGAH